jgi:hypothetical protein
MSSDLFDILSIQKYKNFQILYDLDECQAFFSQKL